MDVAPGRLVGTAVAKRWLQEHEEHEVLPTENLAEDSRGFCCLECNDHVLVSTSLLEKDQRLRAALRYAKVRADAKIIVRPVRSSQLSKAECQEFLASA
jgi:hypothetical protein